MCFQVTVRKSYVTDGQTDGRTGGVAISPVPGPTARRKLKIRHGVKKFVMTSKGQYMVTQWLGLAHHDTLKLSSLMYQMKFKSLPKTFNNLNYFPTHTRISRGKKISNSNCSLKLPLHQLPKLWNISHCDRRPVVQ